MILPKRALELMQNAGLEDIVVKTYTVSALWEVVDRMRMVGFRRFVRA